MPAGSILLPSALRNASGTQLLGEQQGGAQPSVNFSPDTTRLAAVVFSLSATAAAGTATTLNVYVQHSVDGGTTWDDFVSFNQILLADTFPEVYLAAWEQLPGTPWTPHKAGAAALTAGSVLNGVVGSDWRVQWVLGGTGGPSVTFSLRARQINRR